MSEDRFMAFFRMKRNSFNQLLMLIRNDSIFQNESRNPQASPAIQVATMLYFLGFNGMSTVRGAAQLGIGEGTTRLYCNRSISALLRLLPRLIKWPEPESREFWDMRIGIERESGFPGCVGFLDGTDMILRYGPSYHGETYFNRKKQYALNVQGICDSKRKFTFVTSGFPSSVGDATVFCGTSFFKRPNLFFSRPDEYILADKAYRVTRRCMTPYKQPLASQEAGGYKNFNLQLAEARVKVEHAFGVLKNRWSSLREIPIRISNSNDHVRVVAWIMACIILHNFLCDMENDQQWWPVQVVGQENRMENNGDLEDEILGLEAERQAGTEWRNRMREYFVNRI